MSFLREAEKCLLNQKTFASLNAFITPLERSATWRERAQAADHRRGKDVAISPLDGKLVGVKDNICTSELPTTCGSATLQDFTSPFNATVVDLLENAGAIVAGKTNLDEFGMGSHSIHSHFGPVKNNKGGGEEFHSAGGSSGGSAVAVATGQCHAALGTDTGGSVRLPAAYTGVFGFKPSYGLISRWGVVAYANSLDTVGIFAKDTSTIHDIFDVVNRYDSRDPTSISPTSRSRILAAVREASAQPTRLRIGVPLEYNIHELSSEIRSAWQIALQYLESKGHSIHPITLPATKQALSAYYVLAPAEASSNLAKYDGVRYGTRDIESADNAGDYLYSNTRGQGFGAEVRRRILLGTFSLSADKIDNYFIQAQKIRRLVQADFNSVFRLPHPLLHVASTTPGSRDLADNEDAGGNAKIDVIICPTAPSTAPAIKALKKSSPIDAYTNDVFTVPCSLAGLPALSVPILFDGEESKSQSVPRHAGVQVIGQFGDDSMVLEVGKMLEEIGKT
ncbi:aspartyl/glutamyl-tRNA(Asn/Gln) amidotransferase, A subunit [Trichophyton rubrum D6]|uniref:Glutamyl-tRNA(Gln) amidotransferase subunit A, mitochondrial n=3 Tax=Trichophyton TaxID=5550 RepID=F2SSE7_TRIRC|nr:aspartyl/glutamyl-tRNA(Asn/Gln) amidotransferase, A subunit [Trichophyton rubrum CBS 118892]EZF24768.1 aspartyl/glutamyl-tRNA(Asn/Gln) amidotransferase, A subunit [Trichophyton rubrum MR850]EZF43811.1 aspartyl/glutamyl-tRNA(Asn/Gln) amidotransferase, A subunit [Trichophyton rubrum CBS 100081]EZF54453.1 aspartyl/glutamyl-tRNA(Asn/Gln) amidotransferase, A subunit [Trichophyton rubrum CBS 288.86]EZF65005.1 aspartyl/glutamyl-tRNA(Asn/Gln) amidotransferase, A subunit [Trichophyton rubrum CBS 289.